jgi:hypothetical protein
MVIENGIHFRNRATMLVGDPPDTLVEYQILALLIHGANLPLSACLAYSDAPKKIMCNRLQKTEQLRFLVEDRDHELVMAGLDAFVLCDTL